MDVLGLLAVAAAMSGPVDGTACPPPQQPALGQVLTRMINADRPDDALDCLRGIQRDADLGSLTDEVRYQLGLLASEAIFNLTHGSPPMKPDARHAAELWDAYLTSVGKPYDPVRINTALKQLVQYGRFTDFNSHLTTLIKGTGKLGSALRPDVAELLISTIQRCPSWDRTSSRLACQKDCKAIAESALDSLENELGKAPWTGSEGLTRLSSKAQGLKKEVAACHP